MGKHDLKTIGKIFTYSTKKPIIRFAQVAKNSREVSFEAMSTAIGALLAS
jgi:hypothetical protein